MNDILCNEHKKLNVLLSNSNDFIIENQLFHILCEKIKEYMKNIDKKFIYIKFNSCIKFNDWNFSLSDNIIKKTNDNRILKFTFDFFSTNKKLKYDNRGILELNNRYLKKEEKIKIKEFVYLSRFISEIIFANVIFKEFQNT